MIMPVVLIHPMNAAVSMWKTDKKVCLIIRLSYPAAVSAALSIGTRNPLGSIAKSFALRQANAHTLSTTS